MDRAREIFGNRISDADFDKACKAQAKNLKKFGSDLDAHYLLEAVEAPVIGSRLGVRQLRLAEEGSPSLDLSAEGQRKPVVIGNIRMGFGHYRIAMAFASCANALGYDPYWFDLCGFPGTTCTKLVEYQNGLYSMGSRLSQKVGAFNNLYWEPLNSEGFRQLTYNAGDQKNAELMVPVYRDLPQDVPFIGTHAWPSQGAIHAGLTNVVNAIPDNWPMALHLAEGSLHTVQTPSAFLGYKTLRGMAGDTVLKPMPEGCLVNVGHYIDHELVSNISSDCAARKLRAATKEPVRYLICVGGAGAQQDYIITLIRHLLPALQAGEASLMVNVGDHMKVWKALRKAIPELKGAIKHFNDFDDVETLCINDAVEPGSIHAFCDKDIFGAVYSTNLLMRVCDILVTKPSELAYYPVPKLMIKRVGGHEAWGAIRAAELGDGTFEMETAAQACAMIDCIQNDRSIITQMCDCIEANAAQGIYNGAYEGVKLACGI